MTTPITLTVDSVMALSPCSNWPRERVEEWAGKHGGSITLERFLRCASVSAEDRIWLACAVLARENRPLLLRWTYATAERACRVHAADALDRAGLREHALTMRGVRITDEDAAWAARDAAWAAWDAARDAARAAAGAAAGAAAWAAPAAAGAAGAAEQRRLLADLRRLLRGRVAS